KCNKLTDAQVTVNDLGSTDPEENGRGEKPDGVEVREITFKSAIFDKRVRISSWIPSAKYALSGSRLKFSNGRTAMLFSVGSNVRVPWRKKYQRTIAEPIETQAATQIIKFFHAT